MATFFDYLDWYGDLDLSQVPFNEVDALILANLAYVDFAGVVGETPDSAITLAEAAPAYQRLRGKLAIYATPSFTDPVVELLPQKLAAGRRFGQAKLERYRQRLDEESAEQFAALTVELGDGSRYVAFRGTDDTLVGWHENFCMSYEVVPSQRRAAAYLDEVCANTTGPIHVGGHSKGGNLAVFAVAHAQDAARERVVDVWDMDGPGFAAKLIEPERYKAIQHLVRLYVPRFDIVGQLLSRQEPTKIVASSAAGVLQHSATSWQVLGPSLVAADPQELDPAALSYSKDFNDWFAGATDETRERVFDEFFSAAAKAHVATLTEFCSGNPRTLAALFAQIMKLEPTAQHYVFSLVETLTGSYIRERGENLGKDVRQMLGHLRGEGAAIDPNGPLSARELHAYRRRESAKQVREDVLALLGADAAEQRRSVAAILALTFAAGLAVWGLSAHRTA